MSHKQLAEWRVGVRGREAERSSRQSGGLQDGGLCQRGTSWSTAGLSQVPLEGDFSSDSRALQSSLDRPDGGSIGSTTKWTAILFVDYALIKPGGDLKKQTKNCSDPLCQK